MEVTHEIQLLLCLTGSTVQDHFTISLAKVVCINASRVMSAIAEFSCFWTAPCNCLQQQS